jgi:hypothetical protein
MSKMVVANPLDVPHVAADLSLSWFFATFELGRQRGRLESHAVFEVLASEYDGIAPVDVDALLPNYVRRLEPVRKALLAGQEVSLDEVAPFIFHFPRTLRTYRTGAGDEAVGWDAMRLEQRIAWEIHDLFTRRPRLSTCRRCGRPYIGRCRAYRAARAGERYVVVEACNGVVSAPVDDEKKRRALMRAVQRERERLGQTTRLVSGPKEREYVEQYGPYPTHRGPESRVLPRTLVDD